MSNFTTIFAEHFSEFLDDVQSIFPDDVDILTAKNALMAIRKANPKLLVKFWVNYVVVPYKNQIDNGDITFFLTKDYSSDLARSDNADKIMSSIDRLRGPISQMNSSDQQKTIHINMEKSSAEPCENNNSQNTIPEEFFKIISDFTGDILITFPEYKSTISQWWNAELNKDEQLRKQQVETIFKHCTKVFPERFFDILYKNTDIFSDSSDANVEFLPNINFKILWKEDISENTRETIWKYLQLIMFSVIGSMNNTEEFGDTAKLFEAINEEELKTKLEETLKNMQDLFDVSGSDLSLNDFMDLSGNPLPNMMPNADDLHQHINSMLGGKLGKLAMELAEETAQELNLEMENVNDTKGVFQKLFKNPGKLMNMVKNIGNKLDEKLKSGEIKESEIISEGMELLNKMKSMPGMGNMEQMFSQMGIPGLGKGGKINMGAMEAQLNRNLKTAKMKERMRNKVDNKKNQQTSNTNSVSSNPLVNEEEIIKVFSTGEKVERTPRGAKPPTQADTNKAIKKKKSKK
jgi:hypothetical protein